MKTLKKIFWIILSVLAIIVLAPLALIEKALPLKFIQSIRKQFRFWNAKRKANTCHKLTGKRYHVVPGSKDKLIVVDNSFVEFYNQASKKTHNKKIDIYSLLKMSYYSTPAQGLNRK